MSRAGETAAIAWVLVVATLAVAWPLLLPWIYDTHDGHYAFYNAAQFDLALRDGQLPVRWLPDLFGGRGLPHFLFYHPLAFYLASLLHLTGLGYIASIKGVYLLSLPLSGLAAYRWLAGRISHRAAMVGAAAYLLAPYRAVEIHVKGDPPVALAFVFLPLVLLAVDRIAEERRWGVTILALSSAGLVLAHSVTAFIALPALALYAALEVRRPVAWARIGVAVGLGALLSAFHWLPALAEKALVHVDSPLGILFFDFRDHFLAPWQWLSPLWGYHGSFEGTRDDMSFQIGPVHAAGILACAIVWRRFESGRERRLAAWALAVTAFALLGTLPFTRPFWELVGPMRMVQFPWRLLTLVTLSSGVCFALAVVRAPAGKLLAAAAVMPPVVTLVFAAATGNRFYWLITGYYTAAGAVIWVGHRWWSRRTPSVAHPLCALLAVAALPWTAVPLHSALKGEPAVIDMNEEHLAPERVRLGIRRTTARDDYLPRSVERIPPRDAGQEYLPPAGAAPPRDAEVTEGDCRPLSVSRSSRRLALDYEGGTPCRVTLNLHHFPGWRASLVDADRPLDHGHDPEGRVVLDLPAGRHTVQLEWTRTRPRRIGDGLSMAALALLVGTVWQSLRSKNKESRA